MKASRLIIAIAACLLLSGFNETPNQQIQGHIVSNYPASGNNTQEIEFDWGSYLIITHARPDKGAEADPKSYRGYITMRPTVTEAAPGLEPLIYLITPKGSVWSIPHTEEVPRVTRHLKELTMLKGTSTKVTSVTIELRSEPIIDHFLEFNEDWTEYGKLEKNGDRYELRVTVGGG